MPTQSPLKQPPYNLPTPHCLTPHGDTPLLTCTTLTGTLEYIYSTTLTLRPPSLPPPPPPHTGTLVETYQYINPLPTEIPICSFLDAYTHGLTEPPPNWVHSCMDTHIHLYVYHVMFTNVYRNPTQSGTLIHGYLHMYTMLCPLMFTNTPPNRVHSYMNIHMYMYTSLRPCPTRPTLQLYPPPLLPGHALLTPSSSSVHPLPGHALLALSPARPPCPIHLDCERPHPHLL